jgi:hypothetical protein
MALAEQGVSFFKSSRAWISVPVVSLGMVGLALGLTVAGIAGWESAADIGRAGCVLGSILLAAIAYVKPRKDIVALLTPLYALIIFFLDPDLGKTVMMQILYAISITILAVRLERRFSQVTTPVEKSSADFEDLDDFDEE